MNYKLLNQFIEYTNKFPFCSKFDEIIPITQYMDHYGVVYYRYKGTELDIRIHSSETDKIWFEFECEDISLRAFLTEIWSEDIEQKIKKYLIKRL